jgi:hypothetical protein
MAECVFELLKTEKSIKLLRVFILCSIYTLYIKLKLILFTFQCVFLGDSSSFQSVSQSH